MTGNPNLFFNGDRAAFVKEIRKKAKSKTEQLEAEGQMNMLENATEGAAE